MEMSNELEILKNVESIVGSDTISHTEETKARLLSLMSDDLPLVDTAVQSHKDMICQIIDVPKKKEKPTEQVQQQPQLPPKKIEAKPPPEKEERSPKKEAQTTDQQPQKKPKKQPTVAPWPFELLVGEFEEGPR